MNVLFATDLPKGRGHFEVRDLSPKRDLSIAWKWWNADHVRGKWSMESRLGPLGPQRAEHTIDDLREYLEQMADGQPSDRPIGAVQPVIGVIDGVDAIYIEVYDVARSPLAYHPKLEPGDRGVHLIIGEQKYLGKGLISWVAPALLTWQFEAHPGAQRVVVEPDARNARAIHAAEQAVRGIVENKGAVALGHKVATLLVVTRSSFASFRAHAGVLSS